LVLEVVVVAEVTQVVDIQEDPLEEDIQVEVVQEVDTLVGVVAHGECLVEGQHILL
jgi:hypothetical protein